MCRDKILHALLLFCVAIGLVGQAGCHSVAGLPEDAFQAEADAVAVMAMTGFRDIASTPDEPEPDRNVGDKCDNCGGSGRSGDGLGKCRVCGGDGRIDRDDLRSMLETALLPMQKSATVADFLPADPKIEIHVPAEYRSGWLVDWWTENKKILAERYPDTEVTVKRGESPEPWVKVCGTSSCASIFGPITLEELQTLIEKVNR